MTKEIAEVLLCFGLCFQPAELYFAGFLQLVLTPPYVVLSQQFFEYFFAPPPQNNRSIVLGANQVQAATQSAGNLLIMAHDPGMFG